MESHQEPILRYVFYLEDGMGREFFLTDEDRCVPLQELTQESPMEVSSLREIGQQLKRLRGIHPVSCQLFALERSEFDQLRAFLSSTTN